MSGELTSKHAVRAAHSSCYQVQDFAAYQVKGQSIGREVLGARNRDFIQKASRSRGCVDSCHKVSSYLSNNEVLIRVFFLTLIGEGMWLFAENFLMSKSFVLVAAVMFLWTPNKTSTSLCSATFHLCMNGKIYYTFKGQSLENGLSCMFQAIGSILNTREKQQNTKVKVKETDLIRSQICSSWLRPHLLEGVLCTPWRVEVKAWAPGCRQSFKLK